MSEAADAFYAGIAILAVIAVVIWPLVFVVLAAKGEQKLKPHPPRDRKGRG